MGEKTVRLLVAEKVFYAMAWLVLKRHHPYIIGITGSVGKTTTKDMIACVLRGRRSVWYTQRNYNNEIGVPLTIMGVGHTIDSISGLWKVFVQWIHILTHADYPEVLVVEMGVDRKGDMDYLMDLVDPDMAILTAVSQAHSAFFDSIEDIAHEKQKIITRLKDGGIAIVNGDDPHVVSVRAYTERTIITYGTKKDLDFVATDMEICFWQCAVTGLSFKLNYDGKVIPVRLGHVCAKHLAYAALAALAVADQLHINTLDAVAALADFVASPGRMRLLDGINGSLVIDDTYNASPRAMKAAIETLSSAPANRTIAVLGDMRELGMRSKKEHEKIAQYILAYQIDQVFLVGDEMRYTYHALMGKNDHVVHFVRVEDAVATVVQAVQKDDVVLVKGSRGIHMEMIARAIVVDRSQTL